MSEEEKEMTFLDHLEALRWHLVRSFVAIVIVSIGIFVNKSFVFDTIIFGPKSENFITYRALCKASTFLQKYFSGVDICIGKNLPDLQNISMAGQFTTHILIALIGGLVVAFPYIIWEMWRFIKPGLKKNEKNYTTGVVFFTSFLFISGVLFGYFIISPLSVNFFITYNISDQVLNLPTLSTYISTVTTIVVACGFVFELPILVYFLTKVGLITPEFLKTYRKHSIVGALILSAVITPPDVFSQLLVCVPIMLLYEISIVISRIVIKNA